MDHLAHYIINDLFNWMEEERCDQIEPDWRRNYAAFIGDYNSVDLKKFKEGEGKGWRSTVFVRLTWLKTIASFSNVAGLMLQKGSLPWDIKPSPIPDGMTGYGMDPMEAKSRCDGMKKTISDDLQAARADKAYLTSAMEGAIYGLNWFRGPVVRPVQKIQTVMGPDGRHTMIGRRVMSPVVESPSVWNTFWDLETADIQEGKGVIIREMVSKGRLYELAETDGYDRDAILKIAEQAADETSGWEDSEGPIAQRFASRKRVVPIYSCWVKVPRRLLGEKDPEQTGDGREANVFVVCAGLNDPVVIKRPTALPLERRMIHMAKWQELPHESGGVSVPQQMQDSQAVINGLVRAMLDNLALSSNLMGGVKPEMLAPGQNKLMYPGKMFELDMNAGNIREALDFFYPPNNSQYFPPLVEMFKNFADEETGIDKMMQGVRSPGGRTATEIAQIAESGNRLIGTTIRNQDEGIIEPTVMGYYIYHMLANPDESIKGDFSPEATGYQSYIDRNRRSGALLNSLQLALSSQALAEITKIPDLWRETVRVQDLDVDDIVMTVDELEQRAAQAAQQPNPEAQMAAAEMQKEGIQLQQEQVKLEQDKTRLAQEQVELQIKQRDAAIDNIRMMMSMGAPI